MGHAGGDCRTPSEKNEEPLSTPVTGRRRRPRWANVLIILLGLVILAALLLWGLARFLTSRVDENVARRPLMPTVSAAPSPGATPMPRPTRPASAKESLNILLVRNDAPGAAQGKVGSVVVAHLSDDRKRVDLVNVPVTATITVPGRRPQRLDALYAQGGSPGLVTVLEDLLQVPMDHVAEFDPEGFEAMRTLLNPATLANPAAVNETVERATRNVVVDEDFDIGKMQDLAFASLRSGGRPYPHSLTAARPLTPQTPAVASLRQSLRTDDLASFTP